MKLNRHSLFFKIFIALWLTIMIFALTPFFYIVMGSQDIRDAFYEHAKRGMEKEIIDNFHAAARQGDISQLIKEVKKAEELVGGNIYIYDKNNREIRNKQAPDIAIEIINELTDGKIVLLRKFSEEKDDERLIKAFKTKNQFTIVSFPNGKNEPSFAYIIILTHLNILLYILLLASIASLILARYFSKPLGILSKAAREIAEGDFSIRVTKELHRKDEIGLLAEDFDLMAKKLQISKQNQENTLRNISHELRSPLTRLRLSLELARGKAGKKAAQDLNRIELESERLNDMIGKLLEISRINASKNISAQTFYLKDVIRTVLSDGYFEANEAGKKLNYSEDGRYYVKGNQELLISGFENIIRNAIKYSNTRVDISVSKSDKFIKISISDDGEGIGDEHLTEIFKPFYRVQDDRDRKTGGTGLGLAIAKTVIEAHGGKVRAFNNHNKGLCVELLLPAG